MGNPVTPERIMQIGTGAWAAGLLGAGVHHQVFTHLDEKPADAATLAARAGIHPRGAQVLLDGLLGLGLLRMEAGKYVNAPDAAAYLVKGKPTYMGGFARCESTEMLQWAKLGDAVETGYPVQAEPPGPSFFEELVPAIAPLSFPVAEIAARELRLAEAGPISILDIGGGSGVFDAIWLKMNPKATATQVDFASINRIAHEYVGRFGVGDRFRTIDGDFHTAELGTHDIVLYSHIAHMESPAANIANFRRFHAALKPGGTLVINDFVVEDDRSGPPFALIFASNMLVKTHEGNTYTGSEYRTWLLEAGFRNVRLVKTPTPATLIFASR